MLDNVIRNCGDCGGRLKRSINRMLVVVGSLIGLCFAFYSDVATGQGAFSRWSPWTGIPYSQLHVSYRISPGGFDTYEYELRNSTSGASAVTISADIIYTCLTKKGYFEGRDAIYELRPGAVAPVTATDCIDIPNVRVKYDEGLSSSQRVTGLPTTAPIRPTGMRMCRVGEVPEETTYTPGGGRVDLCRVSSAAPTPAPGLRTCRPGEAPVQTNYYPNGGRIDWCK
jgi:hypothetical protein